MLRTLIIVAAVIIVFLIVRNRLRLRQTKPQQSTTDPTRMVQCLSCETYIPVTEAVREGDKPFCCQQHLRDWANKTE